MAKSVFMYVVSHAKKERKAMCNEVSARYLADGINYALRGLPKVTGCSVYDTTTGKTRTLAWDEIYLTATEYIQRAWWGTSEDERLLELTVDYDLCFIEVKTLPQPSTNYRVPFSRISLGGAVARKALTLYEIVVVPSSEELRRRLEGAIEAFDCWPNEIL